MRRVPKPILWWSPDQDGSISLSGVPTNKLVWLRGKNVRQHTPFQIRRRNLLTRIPGVGKGLFGSYVWDIPTVDLGAGVIRSEIIWQATSISQMPSLVDYFFVDGNGGVSSTLTVSNMATMRWSKAKRTSGIVNPELSVNLSTNGSTTTYAKGSLFESSRHFEYTVEGELVAPRDPEVEIEVLNPLTSRVQLLDVAREVLSFELKELASDLQERYLDSAISHLSTFLEQQDVEITVSGESRFTVTADEPVPVSISISGHGPAQVLFAVQVRDLDSGDITISEFMPVITRLT